jgi:hypothetical protein
MLVATVMAWSLPAWATISASRPSMPDLGVEHLVGDALLAEQVREPLGLLDRHGADEDGLALLVALGEVLDDGVELRLLVL